MKEYIMMGKQIESLAELNEHWLPVMANSAALIFDTLNDVNWAGFYIVKGSKLILGPFKGKVACVEIEKGRGVCGTAFETKKTVLVRDVHEFPDHIACDAASESEIVIPLINDGEVFAVLDIDSPRSGRFDDKDREGLERLGKIIEKSIKEYPII